MGKTKIDKSLIRRQLAFGIQELLNSFIERLRNEGIASAWPLFYQFTVECYHTERQHRPSITQLSELLNQHNVANHGNLAVLYAHGLYILALNDGLEIYEDGFNP